MVKVDGCKSRLLAGLGLVVVLLAFGVAAGEPVVEPGAVEFVDVEAVDGLERGVVLRAEPGTVVTRVVTSCECVGFRLPEGVTLPVEVPEGGLPITVTLDARSYEGAFRKVVYVQWRRGDERGMLEIPVTGTVKTDASWEAALVEAGIVEEEPETVAPALEIVPVTAEVTDEVLVQGTTIFVSPTCDMCAWLKLEWLPQAAKSGLTGPIHEVDITTDAGVKRLLAIEEKLGVTEGGDAPAILIGGKLYYGTMVISALDVPAILRGEDGDVAEPAEQENAGETEAEPAPVEGEPADEQGWYRSLDENFEFARDRAGDFGTVRTFRLDFLRAEISGEMGGRYLELS